MIDAYCLQSRYQASKNVGYSFYMLDFLTLLAMGAASKPHMLHLSLLVCPVKKFSIGLWSKHTSRLAFVGKMNISFIDMNTLKYSFVITGHLHWL